MLFIQSKSLALPLTESERLRLLDALARGGPAPLIRSARRRFFELLTEGYGRAEFAAPAEELERACAARRGGDQGPYTPGELFCAGDCVLFLVFGDGPEDGLGAGIIYSIATAEPLRRLESFCVEVREELARLGKEGSTKESSTKESSTEDSSVEDSSIKNSLAGEGSTEEGSSDRSSADEGSTNEGSANESSALSESFELPRWETPPGPPRQQGLARFMAVQPTDFAVVAKCRGGARELMRASELMENPTVRLFLRRVQEMRREGYTPRRLFAEAGALRGDASVERMFDAGLLEREVRVSCRKSGHALFDLPSPDSLAAVTISRAKCSLCAAPVADEVIEETINPTPLAVSLLEDGGWLGNRVYKMIRSLGVPDSEIAAGPAAPGGESYLAADVCGSSFLFVTKDGDLTPALSRRVAETVAETETTHLVVVTTGAIEDEGRLRLYEFAWRRARGGRDLDVTLVEWPGAARAEIERAFERALRRELSKRLFTLDAALGLSAVDFVLDWFRLVAAADAAGGAGRLMPLFSRLDQRVAL